MKRIKTLEELTEFCRAADHVKFYGAGLKLASFMEMVREMKVPLSAECILVSAAKGNPAAAFGIPIVELQAADISDKDAILLTVSECFTADVVKKLEQCGITENIYGIDYTMVDIIPYRKVYKTIEPFIQKKLWLSGSLNQPVETETRYIWSCWWQGEAEAPNLVRKCWESQRRYMPEGTQHIIITWDNYRDYVEVPAFVIEKAKKGSLMPAHLADIVRCCLLYKYGGIWLDATVYLTADLPESCFAYEILTRSTGEQIYCTDVSWVTWFLGGKKGQELYRFLMKAFFYYLKDHESLIHYYMIDFLIAIACREISGIASQMQKIPVNNVNAAELQKYLGEKFDRDIYCTCTAGGFLQKLTYKGGGYGEDSMYRFLMDKEIESEEADE